MRAISISKFRLGLFAAVLAVAPLSPALHGQNVGMIVNVNVPFAFQTASGHHFNPGIYSIKTENIHTLLIRGDSDVALTPATAEDNAEPAKTGKATFRRYGNEYFLTEITVAGSSRSLWFAKSKEEKRVQVAIGDIAPANVEVALLGTAH
jgi:hypothetical protein